MQLLSVLQIQIHLLKTSVMLLHGHVMIKRSPKWIVYVMRIGRNAVNEMVATIRKRLINVQEFLLNTILK